MFVAALLMMAKKNQEQIKRPLTGERINTPWYRFSPTVKCHSAGVRNELLIRATTWITPRGAMLNKGSQAKQ